MLKERNGKRGLDMPSEKEDLRKLFRTLPEERQERIIREGLERVEKRGKEPLYSSEVSEVRKELQKKYAALSKRHTFKPGQLVTWKSGFRNRRVPVYGECAIVVSVLPEPVLDPEERSAGSPLFREPLDIVLGILDEDGELLMYHFDSRRFEPFESPAPKNAKRSRTKK